MPRTREQRLAAISVHFVVLNIVLPVLFRLVQDILGWGIPGYRGSVLHMGAFYLVWVLLQIGNFRVWRHYRGRAVAIASGGLIALNLIALGLFAQISAFFLLFDLPLIWATLSVLMTR